MRGNILIVDDEEGLRYTLRCFLEDEGHRVFTAQSYSEALAVLSEVDIDLIFSDIVLGGRTGIDLLREVRKRNAGSLVVIITGYPDVGTASEAVRLGAFDYIPKPVVQETVLKTASRTLRHKALVDSKERTRSNMASVFRSIKDAIISVDTNLTLLELNDSARTICSLSQEAVGHSLTELASQCNHNCLEALQETIATQKIIHRHGVECRCTGRAAQVVNLSVFPLLDHQNHCSGAVMLAKTDLGVASSTQNRNPRNRFHNIVGGSEEMQKLYDLIDSLCDVQTTVLIAGESGTGKELIADALHSGGDRSSKPIVKVNCGALPDNLLENELFGHVKGAFTGATTDAAGRFQRADGGTIFLDEIGTVSRRMQLSLLRVLEQREFERVGESTPTRVDVRVVVATNEDLLEKVRQGEFREDLYYRLKVVKLTVPPLRERREDIPLLVEHFLSKFNHKMGRSITNVSEEVMTRFMQYPWPGNVRELEHAIEHAFILCRQETIAVAHLPSELSEFPLSSPGGDSVSSVHCRELDREAILKALEKAAGNRAKAASILGISKRTIFRKIKEYHIVESEAP